LKVVRQSLLVTSEGSEFQADEAEHRKTRFASSVLVNGTASSGISGERKKTYAYFFRLAFDCPSINI